MQSLARRLEDGGALSCAGISASAQPFFAALLENLFPQRPVAVVTENLKTQESFQQDLETWLGSPPQFYPAWEIFPHEGRLPHADVITERLQTLVSLSDSSRLKAQNLRLIVTSVTALLQKTFPPGEIQSRTRTLERGANIAPPDLVEFLEAQGYEPEAQVSQKGEIALRGGIVDLFPPTSPWPVRLEFFGDELESLRHFNPLTQIAREEIFEIVIPPAGEIGILKHELERGVQAASSTETKAASGLPKPSGIAAPKRPEGGAPFATLLDHLPRETIFVLCEPEALGNHAETYAQQIPPGDPFLISWPDFLAELKRRNFTTVELSDAETIGTPVFASLDAFRPLAERAPEPQVAEMQRREFFQQLHRWLRQDYAVHVFCNNDGERQRFEEIWKELGLDFDVSNREKTSRAARPRIPDAQPHTRIGSLARGFICDEAKLVVVTDAEIFGRYKIQRPRRLKSPHALAARSALDIDFTDLEEGDLVVHLQHGIGRYLGLKNLPATTGKTIQRFNDSTIQRNRMSRHRIRAERRCRGAAETLRARQRGASRQQIRRRGQGAIRRCNTLGGTRWHKAKEQTEKAVRDIAAEMLRIQAVRETQPGHAVQAGHAMAARI